MNRKTADEQHLVDALDWLFRAEDLLRLTHHECSMECGACELIAAYFKEKVRPHKTDSMNESKLLSEDKML